MKWGAATSYNLVINARSEDMFFKPMFRKLIRNRCVILISGYF